MQSESGSNFHLNFKYCRTARVNMYINYVAALRKYWRVREWSQGWKKGRSWRYDGREDGAMIQLEIRGRGRNRWGWTGNSCKPTMSDQIRFLFLTHTWLSSEAF